MLLFQVKQSGELLFMDSTGNVDRHNCRVFLLMTHCAAGGVPVGCFLTTSETQTTIEAAFRIYKELLSPDSFNGRGVRGPCVIMTDDCDAERNAIRTAFPDTMALLCTFHVLQAMWRWLWDAKHEILHADRPELFHLFKRLMYASSCEELDELYETGTQSDVAKRYPQFTAYLVLQYARKDSWALCYRSGLLVRGNCTNNVCEAAMRILKDNILARTKAFNLVQLLDFVVCRMDLYYQRRILDAANNRLQSLRYRRAAKETYTDPSAVKQLAHSMFEVKSQSMTGVVHSVDMDVEICSCHVGLTGCWCKHQAAVAAKFNLATSNQVPRCSPELRHLLYSVATGNPTAVDQSFFASLNEDDERKVLDVDECEARRVAVDSVMDDVGDVDDDHVQSVSEHAENRDNEPEAVREGESCQHLLQRFAAFNETITSKVANNHELQVALQRYLDQAEKIKSDAALGSALHSFGRYSGLATTTRKGNRMAGSKAIGVQPTAVGRRRTACGGKRSLQSGRPTKRAATNEHGYSRLKKAKSVASAQHLPNRRLATPHNLAECISRNASLGKTHSKK